VRVELTDIVVEQREALTVTELAEAAGLTDADLRELVAQGVLVPLDAGAARLVFSVHTVTVARTAVRLRKDFGLDSEALALAMTLLDRIRSLESEMRQLRAQLPHAAP
jgi:chaperone modulatory protein CbpM